MSEQVLSLLPGTIIRGKWNKDIYQVEDLLGQGGCGAVYLVRDLQKKLFALKISQEQTLLNKEYQLLQELNKEKQIRRINIFPAVYQLDDFYWHNKYYPYLVMEYVEGLNLQQLLKKREKFNLREVLGIALLLALALEKIHAKGYIYGDLKLENLLYNEQNGQLRMIDLGGMGKVGEAVKAFTPLYDRASWRKGTRKGDYQYDLFAFSMLLSILASGKKSNPHKAGENLDVIFSFFPSGKDYSVLKTILKKGLKQEYKNISDVVQELLILWETSKKGETSFIFFYNWKKNLNKLLSVFVIISFLCLIFSFCLFFS